MVGEMTPRERLLATIRHEEPDRVPIAPRWHMWAGEEYGDHTWLRQLKIQEEFGTDPLVEILFRRANLRFDSYRGSKDVSVEMVLKDNGDLSTMERTFHTPAGDLSEVIDLPRPGRGLGSTRHAIPREPLVKGLEDVEKLRFLFPDPRVQLRGTNFPEIIEIIGERGLLQVGVGGASSMVRMLGRQNAMLTYYDDREMFGRLIEVYADHHMEAVKAVLETGVPVIYNGWHDFGVSGGWSPRIYREAFKPVIKATADLVHSYDAVYLYFDNGAIRPLLEDVAEIGTDILSSLCPPPVGDVDLAEAKARIGDRVCLLGSIDTIYVVQKGTPEQVREAVRDAIQAAAPGGGYILGTSDCFFPGTPRQNIQAFVDAGREFGCYPIDVD